MSKDKLFSLTRKDFTVEYSTSSKGAGGQRRDKKQTAVKITHPASGSVGYCQDTREQSKNRKIALQRLTESVKFKAWLYGITHNIKTDAQIEAEVDKELNDPNITKVEYFEN